MKWEDCEEEGLIVALNRDYDSNTSNYVCFVTIFQSIMDLPLPLRCIRVKQYKNPLAASSRVLIVR